jgi:DNA replication protein DnaC
MNAKLSNVLPKSATHLSNLEAARQRIAAGKVKPNSEKMLDSQGRCYIDIEKTRQVIQEGEDKKALRWHKNDPNVRLDEYGFPRDHQDRKFILTHDFGKQLSEITRQLKNGSRWIYLHGKWGLGKTSIATRAIWELIKPCSSAKATYISINHWVNDQMPDGEKYTPVLRKLVLLDDFDKFEVRSDFQVRAVLRLIEQLKERNSLVLITSQFSLEELLKKNKHHIDFQVMIDRIRGKSVVLDKFVGESKRGILTKLFKGK